MGDAIDKAAKLLPCPFCGKAPKLRGDALSGWEYTCECSYESYVSPEAAAGAWNRRTHLYERWNIEPTGDGLAVCRGDHERSQGCQWEHFVPRSGRDALLEKARGVERELAAAREEAGRLAGTLDAIRRAWANWDYQVYGHAPHQVAKARDEFIAALAASPAPPPAAGDAGDKGGG